MGACIGKKSSKYAKRDQPQSNNIQAPQPKVQDDVSQNKSSPSSSKRLPATDGLAVNFDDECRTSKIDADSIDSEIQLFLDEQEMINQVLTKPFPPHVVSFTDTELEFELANLINENSENPNQECPSLVTTIKSNDAR